MKTFLQANLQQNLPDRRVEVGTGLFGDVAGSLEALEADAADAVALALEWQDLDPRLGYGNAGQWGLAAVADIVSIAQAMLHRIASAIERIATTIPVAISLPTLPLPPLFHTSSWQTSDAELSLDESLLSFRLRLAKQQPRSFVNAARLAEDSAPAGRLNLESDLAIGLPYTIPHAASLGNTLARLLVPPLAKKGLITDLDDTLWHGSAGEIGPENVSWDLAHGHQLHALYQKLVSAFADEGVLIGAVSKNDPAMVSEAFRRTDLLLPADRVFPIEVNWGSKSSSVERILRRWNVLADDVVFVDDSPMELAEVKLAHPGIESLRFPNDDHDACYALLRRLRDLFGKSRISGDDKLRPKSIRQPEPFEQAAGGAISEGFLQAANGIITIDLYPANDPRALELVNKTNQFNLNGKRHTIAEWSRAVSSPRGMLTAISYQDKFGPLGTIAVLQGRREGDGLDISTWVLSCRAFSRRIEHQCLKVLFDGYNARQISFDFVPTAKNGPMQDFFATFIGARPTGAVTLTRAQFEQHCPPLYHRVTEIPAREREKLQSA
ncbi:MAG TPA: HAD-IIIC family phosphatase [Bryobacteraceae bacterium]|nr:HAD-IIIC family phosphatase [Bryobacteraceae bacterium]